MGRDIKLTIIPEDLPESISGLSVQRHPGEYFVIINRRRSEDQQAVSFLHECLHIWHEDHERQEDTDAIERERHEELRRLLSCM